MTNYLTALFQMKILLIRTANALQSSMLVLMMAGAGLSTVDTIIIAGADAPTTQADSGIVVGFAMFYAATNVASLGQMIFARIVRLFGRGSLTGAFK